MDVIIFVIVMPMGLPLALLVLGYRGLGRPARFREGCMLGCKALRGVAPLSTTVARASKVRLVRLISPARGAHFS